MNKIVVLICAAVVFSGCVMYPMNPNGQSVVMGNGGTASGNTAYVPEPIADTPAEEAALKQIQEEARERANKQILNAKRTEMRFAAECNQYLERAQYNLYRARCVGQNGGGQGNTIIQQQIQPNHVPPYYPQPFNYYRWYGPGWSGGFRYRRCWGC